MRRPSGIPGRAGAGRAAATPTRRLHVGLNLIFLVPQQTGGMEIYARELIAALVEQAPSISFTAFINRETAAAKDGPWGQIVRSVLVPVNAGSRPQWVLGEQGPLPLQAARAGVQLLHSLGSTAPAWGPFSRVVTVHDLIYARFPEAHGGLHAKGMGVLVPLAVRRSHRVIADSQSTKRDLIEILSTNAQMIDVVPLGFRGSRAVEPVSEVQLRRRLGLGGRRVLLTLSAKRPHKNLITLIGALARIPPDQRPKLVMPGYPTSHEQELAQRAQQLGAADDVLLLPWVSEEELEGLWQLADAFVYPSLYEGFGLPVLEAMARGVPVACSNASSLPEVAGRAALLFDPLSEQQIAEAIEKLLRERSEAERLAEAGRRQAARFTWGATAKQTIAVYQRALSGQAGAPSGQGESRAGPAAGSTAR